MSWDFDASTVVGVEQAMVAAANRGSFDHPAGKRKMPVATAVLEGRYFVACAEQHNRLVKQRSRDGFVLKFPGEPGDVPAIKRKHAGSIARIFGKRTSGGPEVPPEVGGSKVYVQVNVKTHTKVPENAQFLLERVV